MNTPKCSIACPQRVEPFWRISEVERGGIVKDSGYLAFPYQKEALFVCNSEEEPPFVVVREWDGARYDWKVKSIYLTAKGTPQCALYGYFYEGQEGDLAFQYFDCLEWRGESMFGQIHKNRFEVLTEEFVSCLKHVDGVVPAPAVTVEDCYGSFFALVDKPSEEKKFPWECGLRIISKYRGFTFCGSSAQFALPYPVEMDVFVLSNYKDGEHSVVGAYNDFTGEITPVGDVKVGGLQEGQVIRIKGYDFGPMSKRFWKSDVVSVESDVLVDKCTVQQSPYLTWYYEWTKPQ